jgi:type II secretory pathway component GspD/PulD (secretin)
MAGPKGGDSSKSSEKGNSSPGEPKPLASSTDAGFGRRTDEVGLTAPKGMFLLNFKDTPYAEVIEKMAAAMDAQVRFDVKPEGKFNAGEQTPRPAEEAFDKLHGILLERGFTLIPRDRVIFVRLLADGIPPDLIPQVTEDQLDRMPESLMVTAKFRVYGYEPAPLAKEMENLLSPRGKLAAIPASRMLLGTDKVSVLRRIRQTLRTMDPAETRQGAEVRTFILRHIPVSEADPVIRELLGDLLAPPPESNPIAEMTDFGKLGKRLSSRNFVEKMMPGISMKGVLAEEQKVRTEAARMHAEPYRNALMVTGDPRLLGLIETVIVEMDVPLDESDERSTAALRNDLRAYRAEKGDGPALAERFKAIFGGEVGFSAEGEGRVLMIRARPETQTRIGELLKEGKAEPVQVLARSTRNSDPEVIAEQLEKMFNLDPKAGRPSIATDAVGKFVVIRGTKSQVASAQALLDDLLGPDLDRKDRTR